MTYSVLESHSGIKCLHVRMEFFEDVGGHVDVEVFNDVRGRLCDIGQRVDENAIHTFHEMVVLVDGLVFFGVVPASEFPEGATDGWDEVNEVALEDGFHVLNAEGEGFGSFFYEEAVGEEALGH